MFKNDKRMYLKHTGKKKKKNSCNRTACQKNDIHLFIRGSCLSMLKLNTLLTDKTTLSTKCFFYAKTFFHSNMKYALSSHLHLN